MKKRRSRFTWIVAGPILLLALFYLLLQTPPGKRVLASFLSRTLSHPGRTEVHIGRISGWLPSRMAVDRISVGDARGEWLAVHDVRGRLALGDLWKGRVRVTELAAAEVELARLPLRSEVVHPANAGGNGGAKRMDLVLEDCSVERFRLGSGVAGTPLEYSVRSGGIAMVSGHLFGSVDIRGDAVGRVEINASMTGLSGQTLTIRAKVDEWHKPALGTEKLSGEWEATVDPEGVDAKLQVELVRGGRPAQLSTRLRYAEQTLKLGDLQFENDACRLEGNARLDFSDGMVDVDAAVTLTDTNDYTYRAETLAHVATSNKSWSVMVQYMQVTAWDTASATLAGRLSPDQVNLNVDLADCDLGALPFPVFSRFDGRISGQCSISGATATPEVIAELDVLQFTTSADTLDELPKLDFHISGGVTNGRLFASSIITNFVSGYLHATVAMPCTFSAYPFRFKPVSRLSTGTLDSVLDLAVFNGLGILYNQHVDGYLTTELAVDEGKPSGFILIEQGAYEHYGWGILFDAFDARLDATDNGFVIRRATATDGGSGRIRLSGGVLQDGPDLQLKLTKAKVVRRPEVEATVSGELSLKYEADRPSIKGTLVVDRADILPDNLVSRKPAVLEDYDVEAEEAAMVRAANARRPFPVGLNVTVEMPDQIYVNASLVDAVWGGSVQLRDSDRGLSIKGRIEPRRGFVDFVGKPFQLIDGSVDLDGAVPAVPVLNNLTAEYSRSDISARLVLNGTVTDPQCRLESTPPLPQDEILSHVLFKRDTSSISPYQAIQIASAAQQLSSGLSGPGFLYQVRRVVGVDILEVRESDVEAGDSAVAAGKYITPELYVEVSSTFGPDAQTDMTAEYDLNRHFSVETSAGPKMRPGIGLNWKLDY